MINLKCVKNPTVLLETNITGHKILQMLLISLNASQRKRELKRTRGFDQKSHGQQMF